MVQHAKNEWRQLSAWLQEAHPGFESCLSLRDEPGAVRGLIVQEAVEEMATLINIPSTAMLNPITLMTADSASKHNSKSSTFSIPRHLYPQSGHSTSSANSFKRIKTSTNAPSNNPSGFGRQLDTTELLTLHLALSKDPLNRYPSDWKVYIDTLPRSFRPWHPLSWLVKPELSNQEQETDEWEWWNTLYVKHASPVLKEKIQGVKKRYDADIATLRNVLRKEEPFKSHSLADSLDGEILLWAWLNVNTRSISIPLGLSGPSERMNHTLVPILDMINHSSNPSLTTPRVSQLATPPSAVRKSNKQNASKGATNGKSNGYPRNQTHLIPGKIDLRLIAPERSMAKDEEVLFEYGGHSSAVLFAEYGFCETPNLEGEDKWLDLKYGELDLGPQMDALWKNSGLDFEDEVVEEEKRETLEAIGCWRQNTIHTKPTPAHPSHSLLMTLRVLHLPRDSPKLPGIRQGYSTYISPSNELAAVSTLESMCKTAIKDAEKRLKSTQKLDKELKSDNLTDQEKKGVIAMMRGMCVEEKVIAAKILARIEAGDDLSQ